MCISYETDWLERGDGGEKMYEINQKVSWFAEGRTMVGCVIEIEKHDQELCYLLCESGRHPRNGFYARYADSIKAV